MRIWHLRRIVIVTAAIAIFGTCLVFLSGSKGGLGILESAHIDKIERLSQKISFSIGRNANAASNETCSFPSDGNNNSTLGPKIPLDVDMVLKLARESHLPKSLPWPADVESLFDQTAIAEADLPSFKARIPALVYHKNSFLAFSEARFDGLKDYGNILMVMRRGEVRGHGIVWRKIKLLMSIPGFRINNPSPIVDRVHDAIVLVFAAFPTEMSFNDMMMFPRFPMSKLYVMKSYDLGDTWTAPDDISSTTILKMFPVPVLFVPGPGHSIQLKCGRIVVPCNYFTQDRRGHNLGGLCKNCSNYNRILFSDDGGNSWTVGGRSRFKRDQFRIPIHPNEVMAVEVDQNVVSLNSRTLNFQQPRAVIYSFNGGQTLSETHLKDELVEPGWKVNKVGQGTPKSAGGCQGSMIGFPAPEGINFGHKTWVILINPADRIERQNLSLRLSIDGCQSWSAPYKVHDVLAAYSDITYFQLTGTNGTSVPHLAIIFEGGRKQPYEYTRFNILSLEQVLKGIAASKER